MQMFAHILVYITLFHISVSEGSIPAATKTKYETYLKRFESQRTSVATKKNATLFLKSKFEAAGLTVHLQNFTSTDTSNGQALKGTNVIAVLPGTAYKTAADEVVILAAHIDTHGSDAGGVNNDGTGLVGLLAIAEDLTGPNKCNLKNSVVFAAFDRSETLTSSVGAPYCNKSCGSIEFLKHKANYIGNGRVKLAIVMDCIGNYDKSTDSQIFSQAITDYFSKIVMLNQMGGEWGDFLAITGRSDDSVYLEDFKTFYETTRVDSEFAVTKFQWNIKGAPNAQNRSNLVNSFKDGDQMSFWDANMNAILVTDTCYNRGYMRWYNCKTDASCDVVSKLDSSKYNFMYSAVYSTLKLTKKLTCTEICNRCDASAECLNSTCVCKTGFTGDGFTCTDIDECTVLKPCDSNANCTNDIGIFRCTCETGYTGNGLKCTASSGSLVVPHQLMILSSVFSLVMFLTNAFAYKAW